MKSLALLVTLGSLAVVAQGQIIPENASGPVRIPIRHADPWFVKAMLEGMEVKSPEISTIMLVMGMGQGAAQAASNATNSLFKGGKLVVNPGDNSLWFFPDKA